MVKEFTISERYRLELHWAKVRYDRDQVAVLDGCYLSGPVIKEVWQLNQKDYIDLDFAGQYIIFVDSYYIARLSWNGVNYTPDKIFLGRVSLKNLHLNSVPKLTDGDYVVIDTQDHEDYKHRFNMVYPSYLIRSDGTIYNFKEMK